MGTASLASLGTIAHTQQAQPAPTEAQIAASPAVERLKELLQAVNSGDPAVMKAYVAANGAQAPANSGSLPLYGKVLDLYRRSHGLDLVRIQKLDDSGAVAVVRNKLLDVEQPLPIAIEPQAPHRITTLPSVLPLIPLASTQSPAAELSEEAKLQQIASYLKRVTDAGVFSGVVMIARDGKPVFSQAYGYADYDKKIPNRINTPFNVASIGKVFTSLAIGQLVEQGKLSYDDPLSKFVPDFPDPESANRIKIKHLLSHTAGVGHFFNPTFFSSQDRLRSVQAFLDVDGKEPLKFEPGTNNAYSNSGYLLLGRVIEVVTGENYYDYIQKNVFAPAGMTNAAFPHYDRDPVQWAQAYEFGLDGDRLHYVNQASKSLRRGGPFGVGIASAPDLLKLVNALHAGRIVKPETFRTHTTPKPELGTPNYGYGFFTTNNKYAKRPLIGHGGNTSGVCTEFGTFTDTPYTLIVLSNVTSGTCIPVTAKIVQFLPPTKPPAT